MQQLVLIGGGGHCKSCIEVIESTGSYQIAGILDLPEKSGQLVSGYEIIGTEDDIMKFSDEFEFLITLGQIKSAIIRKRIYTKLKMANKRLATVISSHALVSVRSVIGEGTIVMHGAKVNADAVIGRNCIINTNANIEHDCIVGDQVHISTNAVLNGACVLADEIFIGSSSVLANGVSIPSSTIVGAGTVIHRTITLPGTYAGNPGRKI